MHQQCKKSSRSDKKLAGMKLCNQSIKQSIKQSILTYVQGQPGSDAQLHNAFVDKTDISQ